MTKPKKILSLILIIVMAFLLRTFGLNWDQNQHLHPDERFLTMVVSDISLPKNIVNYFSSSTSTLNPQNHDYDFFAYGNFPILIVRFFGQLLSLTGYNQIVLVGRVISAIFDIGIILVLYFLCRFLNLKNKTTLIICFLYALSIFPIQLSHFFTVDTFTVFFTTLSIYFFLRFLKFKNLKNLFFTGIIFGLALSCKTSIVITLPLFLIFIFLKSSKFNRLLKPLFFLLFIFISFRIFQPYAFDGLLKPSPQFIQSINLAHQMITGEYQYPPNIQWLSTWPLIHPLVNIFFFGLGPFLASLVFMGLKKSVKFHFIFFFALLVFIYQGVQLAKYMRYFYPIYPFLIIFAGLGFESLNQKIILRKIILILIIINTFLFLGIYTRDHSRVQASEWICQNLSGKSLSFEYWDDQLPLNLNNQCNDSNFNLVKYSPFDLENPDKFSSFQNSLNNIDYIVLSSNRFWSPISKNSKLYPNGSKFYQSLFAEQLNFKKIKTFYSYPGLNLPFLKQCYLIGPSNYPGQKFSLFQVDQCSNPGIYFRDNLVEESFTVYDHPEVIIFAKD